MGKLKAELSREERKLIAKFIDRYVDNFDLMTPNLFCLMFIRARAFDNHHKYIMKSIKGESMYPLYLADAFFYKAIIQKEGKEKLLSMSKEELNRKITIAYTNFQFESTREMFVNAIKSRRAKNVPKKIIGMVKPMVTKNSKLKEALKKMYEAYSKNKSEDYLKYIYTNLERFTANVYLSSIKYRHETPCIFTHLLYNPDFGCLTYDCLVRYIPEFKEAGFYYDENEDIDPLLIRLFRIYGMFNRENL